MSDQWGHTDRWPAEKRALLASMAAAGKTDAQAADALGVSRSAIAGARSRFKIASANYAYPRRGIPKDFAEVAPMLTARQAATHYKASLTTIRNWFRAHDLRPVKPKRVVVKFHAPKRVKVSVPRRFDLPQLNGTIAASAQLFLQHYGPVFRASVLNPNATGWIMFGRRVSEEDLIATAYRKGFRPEAMAA